MLRVYCVQSSYSANGDPLIEAIIMWRAHLASSGLSFGGHRRETRVSAIGIGLAVRENVLDMKPPMYEVFIWALLNACTDAVLLSVYLGQTSVWRDQRLQQLSTNPSYPRHRAKRVF